ncbi:MAG: hypothetical protein U9R23_06205 [Candidatus Cloacimonadota bacterium]|nr:hypothetical protein [Candidatus Cloacimonadota bacterium]
MKIKFIFKSVFFLILFIVIFICQITAEQIHLLCVSYAPNDSIKLQQLSKIDSIIVQDQNVIIVSPQKQKFINCENLISIFTPQIFSEISDTDIVHKHARNIITSNLKWNNRKNGIEFIQSKVITLSDSLKIGFMGILTPDLPFLYPALFTSNDEFKFRFGIFDCAREEVDSLKNQKVDFIISLNYLGNFLDEELLRKVPEIDFVIDCFENDIKEYYRNFHQNNILHVDFKQALITKVGLYLHRNKPNQVVIDSLELKIN